VILAGFALATSFTAAAQSASNDGDRSGTEGLRIGIFSGVLIPDSVSFQGSGVLSGLPIAASGKVVLNTGFAVGGLVGYQFSDYLNIDLDAAYVSSSLKELRGVTSIAGGPFAPATLTLDGDLHTIIGFANGTILPFGRNNRFGDWTITSYLGAGPGIAYSEVNLRSLRLGPQTIGVNSTGHETDFATDIILGCDVAIGSRLELGIAYEHVWIFASHLGTAGALQANSGTVSGNVFGLVLEYHI
jgi:opacity protein-like surface antigen